MDRAMPVKYLILLALRVWFLVLRPACVCHWRGSSSGYLGLGEREAEEEEDSVVSVVTVLVKGLPRVRSSVWPPLQRNGRKQPPDY